MATHLVYDKVMGIFRIHFKHSYTYFSVIIRNRFLTVLLKTLPVVKHADPPYASSDIAICKSLLLFYPIFQFFSVLDQSCLMSTSMFRSPAAGLALTQSPGWLDGEGEGRATTSRRTMLQHAKEKRVWAILGFFEVKRPLLAWPSVPWCCCCPDILGAEDFQGLSSNFIFLLVSLSWWYGYFWIRESRCLLFPCCYSNKLRG